jgi:replication factor C subunit 2/4
MALPLSEKYRPTIIDDIILEPIISKKLQNMLQEKEFSNLLIVGNSGVGKTTLVRVIVNSLFGKYKKQGVKELNATDEKVMKIVQEDLESFCKQTVDYGKDNDKYPTFKLIVLDEADTMTIKAQFKINKIIKDYGSKVRFILTCNRLNSIEDALQSNCSIVKLSNISQENIKEQLEIICEKENINYDPESLQLIAKDSKGDLRIAINNLQLINNNKGGLDHEYVKSFFGKRIVENISKIFKLCSNNKFKEALKFAHFIKNEGYSILDIIQLMGETLRDNTYNDICDNDKIKFLNIVCITLYTVGRGIDSEIQLSACIANMAKR